MHLHQIKNPGIPIYLDLGGLDLTAFSISAIATYVLAPDLDACFDLGHCPVEAAQLRHVFLSHCHQDHSAGALRHRAFRRMFGARPSRIFVPEESAPLFREWFAAMDRMDGTPSDDLPQVIRGMAPGDTFQLSGHYEVQAFQAIHRIPSLGFTVMERRRKLKPMYLELPGPEIAQAHRRGEELYDFKQIPLLTYLGDCTIQTLLEHPEIGQSQVLFLEATHLGETSREVSKTWGHTHLDEIIELAREQPHIFANSHIVLKHFSTRYSHHEILAAFKYLPDWLRKKTTLLLPEQAQEP